MIRQCTISHKETGIHCKGCNKFLVKIFSVLSNLPPQINASSDASQVLHGDSWTRAVEVLLMKKIPSKIRQLLPWIKPLLHFITQPQNNLGWGNSRDVHSSMGMKVSKEKEAWSILGEKTFVKYALQQGGLKMPVILLLCSLRQEPVTNYCSTLSHRTWTCVSLRSTKRVPLFHDDQSTFPALSWEQCWLGLNSYKG